MAEKIKRHTALKFFLILIIVGAVLGGVYLKSTGTSITDFILIIRPITTKVLETINFGLDSKSSLTVLQNSYVQCTKDGVKYNGGSKWNTTYTMTSPVMISEGNIVAVSEFNNKMVYVFNEIGELYNVSTSFPIMQFSINKAGYLAVITKDTDKLEYIVSAYDTLGASIKAPAFGIEQNYPLAVDISEDGKYMAVSLLDTSEAQRKSKILFYDLGVKGEAENVDSLLAGVQKDDEIVFSLSYMNDDILIAVTDKSITATHSGKVIWLQKLTNKITALDVSDGKTIALGLGNELPGGSDYKSGTAIWYDLSGNKLGSYEANKEIKLLSVKSNRILVYAGKSIYGFNRKGTLLWEHIVLQDVKQMMLFDNLSNILVSYKNSAQIIDIKAGINANTEEIVETQSKENETKQNPSTENATTESVTTKSDKTETDKEVESL